MAGLYHGNTGRVNSRPIQPKLLTSKKPPLSQTIMSFANGSSNYQAKSAKFKLKSNNRLDMMLIPSIDKQSPETTTTTKSPPNQISQNSRGMRFSRIGSQQNALIFNHFPLIIVILIIYSSLIYSIETSSLQNFCPKVCTCNEDSLEILCKENIGASGPPHTLNPNTKRMIINNAQTSQFSQLDYLGKLEIIDLTNNKISSIDFQEITKNTVLMSLNTSHNSIIELKDSLVTSTFNELGLSASTYDAMEPADLRNLKSSKINVVELVLSHNYLTTIRNFTFMRWHRLQKLDLSYNLISSLETQSLYGLTRLEVINLRNNRLKQVPTLALNSTFHSLTPAYSKPSSLKYIDLSGNTFETIGPDSFAPLVKAQELYLESCSIQTIHEQAFKGLQTLYLLSLDENNLNEVPSKSFAHLSLLRLLKINNNNITNLQPGAFTNLVHLEELQINNGTFSELTRGVFTGMGALKRLEISYNFNLTRIEQGTFESVAKLNYLSLFANSLSSLPDNLNERTHQLQVLDLRGNPLHCGCDLKWLTKWLKKFDEAATKIQQSNSTIRPNSFQEQASFQDTQTLLMDPMLTTELSNLTCSEPPALVGRQIMNLPDNKLECLEPTSELNVHLGFASLFFITITMLVVCLLNFCRNKKHIMVMLKENLVQNQISMMLPYSQNLHNHVDDLKKETQLNGSDYEHIDYDQHQQQIYTIHGEQIMYYPRPE